MDGSWALTIGSDLLLGQLLQELQTSKIGKLPRFCCFQLERPLGRRLGATGIPATATAVAVVEVGVAASVASIATAVAVRGAGWRAALDVQWAFEHRVEAKEARQRVDQQFL